MLPQTVYPSYDVIDLVEYFVYNLVTKLHKGPWNLGIYILRISKYQCCSVPLWIFQSKIHSQGTLLVGNSYQAIWSYLNLRFNQAIWQPNNLRYPSPIPSWVNETPKQDLWNSAGLYYSISKKTESDKEIERKKHGWPPYAWDCIFCLYLLLYQSWWVLKWTRGRKSKIKRARVREIIMHRDQEWLVRMLAVVFWSLYQSWSVFKWTRVRKKAAWVELESAWSIYLMLYFGLPSVLKLLSVCVKW